MHAPLFKGARRPPTVLGVPLVPLYLVCGLCMIGGYIGSLVIGWTAYAIAAVLAASALSALRLVAATDPHALRLIGLRVLMRWINRARTARFWRRVSAYSPQPPSVAR